MTSFASLLYFMDHNYVKTFISTMSGNQYIQEIFTKGNSDRRKLEIFHSNIYKWKPYVGEAIRAWLETTLPKLVEESPDWFDDDMKSTIHDDMVTNKVLLKKIRGEHVQKIIANRRRSMVFEPPTILPAPSSGKEEKHENKETPIMSSP